MNLNFMILMFGVAKLFNIEDLLPIYGLVVGFCLVSVQE